MKEILNNKIDVKLVVPVSLETKGLMMTLANTFVLHGGKLKKYTESKNENGREESLIVETNEIVYHLFKRFINDSFDYIEIEDGELKVLCIRTVGLE